MAKTMKNKLVLFIALLFSFQGAVFAEKAYEYRSYPDDPINARIYTLDNGLKVYLSPYEEEPRIQTYIAVRVGSMHDPAETTGLAHYFEHMMFKGTQNFGTLDWEKEKPLIEEIERLFEIYRKETDEQKRLAIYREIDSISYIASTLAIPNEYDRLMSAIGSTGTNAGTSNDYTIYIENIPSNQAENWAMIQGDRFANPVLRLFHTELETVYEEKNMSLTSDARRASEVLYRGLFPNHPYGLQTTLGDAEHLKNPSMTNIREFFDQYYVPNNMAVVMSGDFDPDEMIRIIDRHFGHLEPSELPHLDFPAHDPITEPIVKEVTGLEAENVQLAWRFEGAASDQVPYINMIRMILFNGQAGLIDQNLNARMETLGSRAYSRSMVDYSLLNLSGRNKSGQTLDEVKELLLEQVEILKKGDFPDWLMEASINNLRLQEMRRNENIRGRAMNMAMSFMNHVPYEQSIKYLDRLSEITKGEIVAFANEHLRDNYVVVYKRQGTPDDIPQVEKPPITPIHINRDEQSEMLRKVNASEVEEIEPVFVDYENDIVRTRTEGNLEVLYVENDLNPTFSMTYFWRMGSYHDKQLPIAAGLINFLGTETMSSEDISNAFYQLACSFNVSAGNEETRITISGLSENFPEALQLFEDLVWNGRVDQDAFARFIDNTKKAREDSKANQRTNFSALVNYARYGPDNPTRFVLTNEELDALTPDLVMQALQQMWAREHKVVYHGPKSPEEVAGLLKLYHQTPDQWDPVPSGIRFDPTETTENRVFFAHYDANQSYLQTISKGKLYDNERVPLVQMYNSYFGGGMNAIVFQEMREKRGLAYSAWSNYSSPSFPDEHYINNSFIATQNDKVVDAFTAFNELYNQMPLSETSFILAKDQIISNIRTQRIRNAGIIWNYLAAKRMGRDQDLRIALYEEIPGMTLEDISEFNQRFIQGQPKTYVILGNENMLNFEEVEKHFGPVIKLDRDELFVF